MTGSNRGALRPDGVGQHNRGWLRHQGAHLLHAGGEPVGPHIRFHHRWIGKLTERRLADYKGKYGAT